MEPQRLLPVGFSLPKPPTQAGALPRPFFMLTCRNVDAPDHLLRRYAVLACLGNPYAG